MRQAKKKRKFIALTMKKELKETGPEEAQTLDLLYKGLKSIVLNILKDIRKL